MAAYVAMLAASGIVLYVIARLGAGAAIAVRSGAASLAVARGEHATVAQVALAFAVIVAAARLLGWLFSRLGQPAVMGEVVAGLMLGPSLLGRLAPQVFSGLFPPAVSLALGPFAQLGVTVYMLLVGIEVEVSSLRSRSRAIMGIAHASMCLPFVMGAALALPLYAGFSDGGASFPLFASFLGVSLCVTAFPVLARLLADRRIEKTPLGTLALGCAAANDLTAWCLLAGVVSMAGVESRGAFSVVLGSLAFLLAIAYVLRPLVTRLATRSTPGAQQWVCAAVVLLLGVGCAAATDAIGIHAVFGAFALGLVVPAPSRLASTLRGITAAPVNVLLVPLFFAATGLRTELWLLSSRSDWLLVLSTTLVATFGKVGGTFLAARLTALDTWSSGALGVLMNTRGMVELIVLNVGMDLGIISARLFGMLVLMAIVTTLGTAPALELLERWKRRSSLASPPAGLDAAREGG
jgi:Kef-type K+ transport system membrane component KefB